MPRNTPISLLVAALLSWALLGCSASNPEPAGSPSDGQSSRPAAEPVSDPPTPSTSPTASTSPTTSIPPTPSPPRPEGPVSAPVAPAIGSAGNQSADPLAAAESDGESPPPSSAGGEAARNPGPPETGSTSAGDHESGGDTNGHHTSGHHTNPRHRPGGKGAPFDPIKENGPIFVGWEPPKLAIVITGRQEGYIEPCGCAGLDRMKGGMSRRHRMFRQLRARGWPVVGLDVGNIAKRFGRQAERKFHIMVAGMQEMSYDAIALGRTDVVLPAGDLLADDAPFVSANVALFGFDAKLTPRLKVIGRGGVKLGVTGVLGKSFQRGINNPDLEMVAPEKGLETVVPALKQQADLLVLLAHASMEETLDLAAKFPDFDLVVTAGGAPEPPAKPARIEGSDTLLIEVGEKGMDAVVLGLYDNPNRPIRYQRVPLDSRFPGTAEMKALLTAYQDELKRAGWSGLGVQPLPHPQKELNGPFVGTQKCRDCHELSYDVWKKSGHAKAYATLAELDPPRQYDPECISCHVVGWNPQGYYPYEGGYTSIEATPHLIDVGCESCHGPGGAHVAAESGSDEALQLKLQKAMVVTKEESRQRQCFTCHDGDNSPDFNFDEYWPPVEHYETE